MIQNGALTACPRTRTTRPKQMKDKLRQKALREGKQLYKAVKREWPKLVAATKRVREKYAKDCFNREAGVKDKWLQVAVMVGRQALANPEIRQALHDIIDDKTGCGPVENLRLLRKVLNEIPDSEAATDSDIVRHQLRPREWFLLDEWIKESEGPEHPEFSLCFYSDRAIARLFDAHRGTPPRHHKRRYYP